MSLWGELKRRNVFKVAAAYLVAAWLIVQIVGVLTDPLNLPDVLDTVVVVLLTIGFPFALVIAWVFDVTPDGIRVTSNEGRNRPITPTQRLTYVLVILIGIAVGLMVVNGFFLESSTDGFGTGSRLAVLPCDDLSPDPTNSFFSVGIHEELLNRLAALSALEVISRTSVQQYAARRPSIPQIASELDADAIMECSARYSGDRVLLTAQLIDGLSDTHLWSDSYPADMSNVRSLFEIQAELAMDVANALHITFFDGEREQIERIPTESREAYELYLAALQAWREPDMVRHAQLIDEVLRIDEDFVDALIFKSESHTFRYEFQAASEVANRVLELEPSNARVHGALGYSMTWSGRWLEAERYYRQAFELGLDPASVPGYALLHWTVGRFDEAIPAFQAYLAVDPMDGVSAGFLMMMYELVGDEDARQRAFDRGERLYSVWPVGAESLLIGLAEGNDERMRAWATESFGRQGIPVNVPGVSNPDSPASAIEALRALYDNVEELGGNASFNDRMARFYLSAWAAFYGDSALAFEWLEEALTLSPIQLGRAWYPVFDPVRAEPGFEQLLTDLGLPEYWDTYGWPEICQQIDEEGFECD